jgi:hypothetical protein
MISEDRLLNATFRNPDCPGYDACLKTAAISDLKRLPCDGCDHQWDIVEPVHFDDFCIHEIEACCRLLHAIFFNG